MSFFSRLRKRFIAWVCRKLGLAEAVAQVKDPGVYRASCWAGDRAEARMMNMLSPLMPEHTFQARLEWMKARGCNTAHLILVNQQDGEAAGYSPWGVGCGPLPCPCEADTVALMRSRILALRRSGFAVIPWLVTDDSKRWARALFADPERIVRELHDAGLIEDSSPMVVLGLEMDEYGSYGEWSRVASALRSVYKGRVGVHHTSGRLHFADLGDVVLGQLPPDCNSKQIALQIHHIREMGKEAIGFEYSRHADREKAQTALGAGAIGCGNW